jgi:hypothetical protein
MAGMDTPARYHLLLALDDVPAMYGWWDDPGTARRQFRGWVGERGRPGARITLTDTETGQLLDTWPNEK